MSIYDLMDAVRNGEFEPKFKECISIDDKIKLFKNYGVVISLNEYKEIEEKVASIKKGQGSSYNDLEDKVESNIETMSELELDSVSAGRKLNEDEKAVFEVLKRMPEVVQAMEVSKDDDDVKWWPVKPYFPKNGLF